MDMKEIFGKALGIDKPWFVTDVNFDLVAKRLDIRMDFIKGSTFSFNQDGVIGEYKAYDTIEKEWRHLNFFEHECYLKARVPRIKTPDNKIHLVLPTWSGLQNGFTLLFEALILQLCKNMPVHNVSQLVKISDHKIWSILDKYTEKTRELSDYSKVTALGMDETSIAKGHDYISLFVDLIEKKTIFVAEGKDNATVQAFKEDLEKHNGEANNNTDVSCDMSPAFIKGVKEVRRIEAQSNPLLTGSRYIFLKNEKNLTANERYKKEELQLSKLNNKVFRALSLRETFQQIYVAPTDESFKQLLKKWYYWATHSRLEPMKQVAKTIKKTLGWDYSMEN